MILTDKQICEAQEQKNITIEPFDKKQVQAASYDLRIGDEAITTSSDGIVKINQKGFITFQPGDFGFLITKEKVSLDNQHTGRFGLRSEFARRGIIAATGPQIDPGYKGKLIIGISNLTPNPVTLSHGEDLLTVEFHKLGEAVTKPYSGPYQEIEGLRPQDIKAVTEKGGMLLSEIQQTLSSLSANVGTLTTRMDGVVKEIGTLKWMIPLWLTLAIFLMTLITKLF